MTHHARFTSPAAVISCVQSAAQCPFWPQRKHTCRCKPATFLLQNLERMHHAAMMNALGHEAPAVLLVASKPGMQCALACSRYHAAAYQA